MLGDGGRNFSALSGRSKRWLDSRLPVRLGEERPSSACGKAMPAVRTLSALAKEDVRFMELDMLPTIVLEILSLREIPGRSPPGEGGGRWENCGEDWRDVTRGLAPPVCGEPRRSSGTVGGEWRVVESSLVNGDSKSRAMI